jgi:crotonobetainyl-CoA:carnitine CoA-transferase CaiB-like acyl-CoA transferase
MVHTEHPTEGTIRAVNVPAQWSLSQPTPTRPAPLLGEQSIEILREVGFTDDEVETMLRNGATFDASRVIKEGG